MVDDFDIEEEETAFEKRFVLLHSSFFSFVSNLNCTDHRRETQSLYRRQFCPFRLSFCGGWQ